MDPKNVLQILNRALQIEYASAIQYLQHSFLVQGTERKVYSDFFRDHSEGSMKQAKQIGEHIVSLGGVPTVEPYLIKQSTNLREMLRFDLELEQTALQIYQEGVKACADHTPLKFFFEEQAYHEYEHSAEIEKLLEQKKVSLTEREIQMKKAKSA
ncbi:MAG: ferritin-like domain-containing protein [Candidatus Manganitrophus sp. SA1]|nr:ferritin-like domain-containing protein [Candidatus Manganitrophus morganii]